MELQMYLILQLEFAKEMSKNTGSGFKLPGFEFWFSKNSVTLGKFLNLSALIS